MTQPLQKTADPGSFRIAPAPVSSSNGGGDSRSLNKGVGAGGGGVLSGARRRQSKSVMDDAHLSAIIPNVPKKLLSGGRIDEDDLIAISDVVAGRRQYNAFLSFQNVEDADLFRKHMKKRIYWPLTGLLFFVVSFAHIQIWYIDVSVIVVLLSITNVLLLGFLVAAHSILLGLGQHLRTRVVIRVSDIILQSFLWGEFEGIFCVMISVTFSLAMLFRVTKGSCSYGTYGIHYYHDGKYSWWAPAHRDGESIPPALSCNPNDSTGGLPYDSLMLMYSLPLFIKFCLKGTHRYAVFLSMLVATFFLIIATVFLQNKHAPSSNMWIIINSTVFYSFLAYEYERFNMCQFLTSKRALEDALAAERERYEQDALMMLAEKDKVSKEQEHDMLRNLIGNVAHDLKTPLLALTMGLEQLEPLVTSTQYARVPTAAAFAKEATGTYT
jgi:hypothetical protein